MTGHFNRRTALGLGVGLSTAVGTAATAWAQTAVADTLAKVKAAGTMLAGVRNDFPPIGSIDTGGKPVGFGPALAEAFGRRLGVKTEFIPTTSRTRIPLLQNGSIDCEFGITTPTVEREKTVDFSIPYVWDAVAIIIKEGASRKVADYAPPKKVATTQGSYIVDLFKQYIANPDIVLFQEYPDAVLCSASLCIRAATSPTCSTPVSVRSQESRARQPGHAGTIGGRFFFMSCCRRWP